MHVVRRSTVCSEKALMMSKQKTTETVEKQISSAILNKFHSIDMRSELFPGELSVRARIIDGIIHTRVEMNEFPVADLQNVSDQITNQFKEVSKD